MAISVSAPTYAFTNDFPNISIRGTANEKLLLSIKTDGFTVLDNEIYHFDNSGIATIRFIGDLLEKYFYDAAYDIRRFAMDTVFTFSSQGETVSKIVTVYFCRSYVSGDKLTPELLRAMPLTKSTMKHTLSEAKEYLSFISTLGKSVLCNITYKTGEIIAKKAVSLYTFPTSDTYSTVDVSATTIGAFLASNEQIIFWDVYLSGSQDKSIRYWLDKPMSFAATTFIYQNDFGGIESFICRGIRKDEIQAERETGTLAGRAFISRQTTLRSFTVNTGTLDTAQKEALISLLSSHSLMVLQDGIAIPVIVSGENVSLHNFRSKLPTAEFTYTYSARNLVIYKYDRNKGIFDYTFDETFN